MAATAQVQSKAQEPEARAAMARALHQGGATVTKDEPGTLVAETGSAGVAMLAGPFRKTEKMPMAITVLTSAGDSGCGISVSVDGQGWGAAAGGLIGARKQKKGEAHWLSVIVSAIPERVS